MHLFQRTLLQGAHDRLVDAGRMLPIATEKLATEVFDKIASDLGLPVMLDTAPNREQAAAIGNLLIDYSQKLAANGAAPDQELMALAKTASTRDPAERAHIVAEYYIQKAAEENSLHESGAPGLSAAAQYDLLARQDLANRSLGAYAVPQGQTSFAMPGVVGRELGAPGAPVTGATVKAATDGQPGTMVHLPGGSSEGLSRWGLVQDALRQGAGHFTDNPLENWRQGQAHADKARHLADISTRATDNPNLLAGLRESHARQAAGRRVGLGMQGAAAAGGLLGLGLGARALYRHFNPEEQPKAASLKQALDMPDWSAISKSVTDRARSLYTGAHNAANQVGNAARLVATDPREIIGIGESTHAGVTSPRHGVRGVMQDIRNWQDAGGGRDQFGVTLDELKNRRNVGLGVGAAQLGLGLGAAAGLTYAGKRLYDHFQGSPEDMEVNASDGSAEALAQSLHEHGIEPTPELIASLMAAMDEEDAGGAPGAEGAPPPEAPKAASEGSLHPVHPGNSLASAAKVDRVAKEDVKNRAPGAHEVPQGQTRLSTAAGEIGAEKKAELAWRENLVNCAQTWGAYLPAAWPEQIKHAAIQEIASQAPSNRAAYVKRLISR